MTMKRIKYWIINSIIYIITVTILLTLLYIALDSITDTPLEYTSKVIYHIEGKDPPEIYKSKKHYPEEMYFIEATYPGVNYDLEYVERVIMAEAGAASLECQMLVAQCISNSCKGTIWNPEDIVKEVHSYAPPYDGEANSSVKEACRKVFVEGYKVTDENVKFFYTQRWGHYSEFHESKELYKEVDGVRFFID